MIKDGKFTGIVQYISDKQQISGDLVKVTLVIKEPEGDYPQSIAVDFLNKAVKQTEGVKVGQAVEMEVKFKANEHKGRYYLSARGWNLKVIEMGGSSDLPF